MSLRPCRWLYNPRVCRSGARSAAAVAGPTTSMGIEAPADAMARAECFCRNDAENDAGAEGCRDGGFELRPNAGREQLEHGGADAARARQQQRAEQFQGALKRTSIYPMV